MSPTIAHALLGGSLALLLYTISQQWNLEKRFTERMVVVFAFNSMIGPDIFNILYAVHLDELVNSIPIKSFVHSLLGWPIWCLGIMWIWYYVVNFKSTKQTKISKRATLLLLIAAGEMHFYLDFLDNGVNLIGFSDWSVHLNLQEHFLTGESYVYGPLFELVPWFSMFELFLIGIVFMILMIYSLFRWQLKYTYIIALVFLITLFILYFLVGSIIFGKENDIGVTLYFGLLFLIPFSMTILAMERPENLGLS